MTKTCTKCNVEFPNTLEYFYKNGNCLSSYCKTCLNAAKNAWAKAHPERMRAMRIKYRALKAGVIHEDWSEKELFETYGTDCYLCNELIDFDAPRKGIGSDYSLWVDHVVPTSQGGPNNLENVRPCHRKCNRSKGTKTYEEYILTRNSQDIVTIK